MKSSRNTGFSLVEVTIAVFVFILAAWPIYNAITEGAKREIDSTKLAMARKINESVRSEVMSQKFQDVADAVGANTTFSPLDDRFYTKAKLDVLDFQKKYKDFELSVEGRVDETRHSVLHFKAAVTWKDYKNQPHPPETLFFMMVKP